MSEIKQSRWYIKHLRPWGDSIGHYHERFVEVNGLTYRVSKHHSGARRHYYCVLDSVPHSESYYKTYKSVLAAIERDAALHTPTPGVKA